MSIINKEKIIFKHTNFIVCDLKNGTYKPYLKILLISDVVIKTKNISRGELDNLKEKYFSN